MNRRRFLSASTALLIWQAGCLGQTQSGEQPNTALEGGGGGGQSGSGATVADAKLKLEGYQSHENAINDGYQNTGTCIEGLGTPFVKDDVSQVSYDTPDALLYQRTDTDQYELMGAEWFVPASDYDDPPSLFAGDDRQTFHGPMEGQYSNQSTHYGLHVWLFAENPNGQFAESNPHLTCSDCTW